MKSSETDRLLRALENDPSVEAEARALDPALVDRLAAGVRSRTARTARTAPVLKAGALVACAGLGLWIGWVAQPAASTLTVLASLEISPIGDAP